MKNVKVFLKLRPLSILVISVASLLTVLSICYHLLVIYLEIKISISYISIQGRSTKCWAQVAQHLINHINNNNHYSPIALTSHLCKLMERIIFHRISHVTEKITNYISGFRKGLSTTDALVRVSNEVEKALKMKELMIIVYFDRESIL